MPRRSCPVLLDGKKMWGRGFGLVPLHHGVMARGNEQWKCEFVPDKRAFPLLNDLTSSCVLQEGTESIRTNQAFGREIPEKRSLLVAPVLPLQSVDLRAVKGGICLPNPKGKLWVLGKEDPILSIIVL